MQGPGLKTTTANVAFGRHPAYIHRQSVRPVRAADQAQDDVIGKAFQLIFGKRAREERQPLGLKRLEGTALQAQYEANTEERASPVEGDDTDMGLVRPLLAGTVLEAAALRY